MPATGVTLAVASSCVAAKECLLNSSPSAVVNALGDVGGEDCQTRRSLHALQQKVDLDVGVAVVAVRYFTALAEQRVAFVEEQDRDRNCNQTLRGACAANPGLSTSGSEGLRQRSARGGVGFERRCGGQPGRVGCRIGRSRGRWGTSAQTRAQDGHQRTLPVEQRLDELKTACAPPRTGSRPFAALIACGALHRGEVRVSRQCPGLRCRQFAGRGART
jgi:hypothetical protein